MLSSIPWHILTLTVFRYWIREKAFKHIYWTPVIGFFYAKASFEINTGKNNINKTWKREIHKINRIFMLT